MDTKFVLIGVGGTGVKAVDMMDIPNSRKVLVDTSYRNLNELETAGVKLLLQCKDFGKCSGFCHCYDRPDFCRNVALGYKDEIAECIRYAFKEDECN